MSFQDREQLVAFRARYRNLTWRDLGRLFGCTSAEAAAACGVTEKRCPRCERTRPFADFAFRTASADGLQCWCEPCQNEARRQQRAKAHEERAA